MEDKVRNELLMRCVPLEQPHMEPQVLVWGDSQPSKSQRNQLWCASPAKLHRVKHGKAGIGPRRSGAA